MPKQFRAPHILLSKTPTFQGRTGRKARELQKLAWSSGQKRRHSKIQGISDAHRILLSEVKRSSSLGAESEATSEGHEALDEEEISSEGLKEQNQQPPTSRDRSFSPSPQLSITYSKEAQLARKNKKQIRAIKRAIVEETYYSKTGNSMILRGLKQALRKVRSFGSSPITRTPSQSQIELGTESQEDLRLSETPSKPDPVRSRGQIDSTSEEDDSHTGTSLVGHSSFEIKIKSPGNLVVSQLSEQEPEEKPSSQDTSNVVTELKTGESPTSLTGTHEVEAIPESQEEIVASQHPTVSPGPDLGILQDAPDLPTEIETETPTEVAIEDKQIDLDHQSPNKSPRSGIPSPSFKIIDTLAESRPYDKLKEVVEPERQVLPSTEIGDQDLVEEVAEDNQNKNTHSQVPQPYFKSLNTLSESRPADKLDIVANPESEIASATEGTEEDVIDEVIVNNQSKKLHPQIPQPHFKLIDTLSETRPQDKSPEAIELESPPAILHETKTSEATVEHIEDKTPRNTPSPSKKARSRTPRSPFKPVDRISEGADKLGTETAKSNHGNGSRLWTPEPPLHEIDILSGDLTQPESYEVTEPKAQISSVPAADPMDEDLDYKVPESAQTHDYANGQGQGDYEMEDAYTAENAFPLTEKCYHYAYMEEVEYDNLNYWHQRYSIFSKYDEGIYMTPDSWCGVTPEPVANKVAEDLAHLTSPTKTTLIDIFAGSGGNVIAFALSGRWSRIIAIEKDPSTIACAQHNASIYGVSHLITWINTDSFSFLSSPSTSSQINREETVIFASPPWGGPGYKDDKIFNLNTMRPYNLMDIWGAVKGMDCALYLPRTSDLRQIARLVGEGKGKSKVEVVQYCMMGASKALVAYVPADEAE